MHNVVQCLNGNPLRLADVKVSRDGVAVLDLSLHHLLIALGQDKIGILGQALIKFLDQVVVEDTRNDELLT